MDTIAVIVVLFLLVCAGLHMILDENSDLETVVGILFIFGAGTLFGSVFN